MKIKLDYGKDGLWAELPDENVVGVLSIKIADPHPMPGPAVQAALENPIGSLPLSEIARGRKNACIVVCDVTRPVPNPIILPEVIRAIEAGGISRRDITILVATGTHRPNEGEELIRMLGEEAATTCRVVNSVCTDTESFRYLGTTDKGVPMKLNKTYLDADLKVTVGLIEPHYMAGYAGGRKRDMPGIAALDTVQAWHSPKFLEHPNATMGVTVGNPVHEESLRITKLAPPDFIIDVALDVQKRLCAVFAGDLEQAWEAGVRYVAPTVYDYVDDAVDIVVTTCGGHPLDMTFYQTVKGMVGALPIVKSGGTVIVASRMSEGVGLPHFKEALLNTTDIKSFPETIQRPDWQFVGDQWQVEELSKAVRHAEIMVVSDGIEPDLLGRLFVTPMPSVERAVAAALARHGSQASIAVIPKGPYVIPQIRAPQAA
jgi:nickel-dependent lactate racemase